MGIAGVAAKPVMLRFEISDLKSEICHATIYQASSPRWFSALTSAGLIAWDIRAWKRIQDAGTERPASGIFAVGSIYAACRPIPACSAYWAWRSLSARYSCLSITSRPIVMIYWLRRAVAIAVDGLAGLGRYFGHQLLLQPGKETNLSPSMPGCKANYGACADRGSQGAKWQTGCRVVGRSIIAPRRESDEATSRSKHASSAGGLKGLMMKSAAPSFIAS